MAVRDSRGLTPRLRVGLALAGFILLSAVALILLRALALALSRAGLLDDAYLGTVLQFFEAAGGYYFSGIEAGGLGQIVVGGSCGDIAGLRLAVLNGPDERLRAVLLDGGRIDERYVVEGVN